VILTGPWKEGGKNKKGEKEGRKRRQFSAPLWMDDEKRKSNLCWLKKKCRSKLATGGKKEKPSKNGTGGRIFGHADALSGQWHICESAGGNWVRLMRGPNVRKSGQNPYFRD
jgi:hypothetical protein